MYKNSKRTVLFPLILAAGIVAGAAFGLYMGRNSSAAQLQGMLQRMRMPENKLTQTLSFIENLYVDSVSMDSLSEHVIPLVVKELDPHSVYIPADEMAELNEPLEGEFDGIGVVFNMATDTVIVLNVIPHGPSDKSGVVAGDRIIEIDDSLVAGQKIPQNRIVKRLRGPRGTKVKLGLQRQHIDGLVDVEVVRDVIPIKSIEASFRIADSIGYVKLGQFARTSIVELHRAIAELRAEGVTKLIFDLRGNAGGYLDQAIAIANEFLHEGQLIVYTEDRAHEQLREYANGSGSAQDMEVVVLIDEGSASSSEILAGALQDNDRGTIIGRRSFGKGLVQRQIPYSDGSALRLTIARYYTPTGRSIQKPYTIGDEESYAADMVHRYENNEFFLGRQHPVCRFASARDPGRQSGLWRWWHHARHFRAGRYDRRDALFLGGRRAQYPLSLHDRVCRPAPRSTQQSTDAAGTETAVGQRSDAGRRFRALCRPSGRCAAPCRHRTVRAA